MSRRDIKGCWLVSGLVCIAIDLYSATHEQEQPEPGLGSVIREHTGMTSTSSTPENISTQEMQRIGHAKPHALDASTSANSSVAGLPPMEATRFLEADAKSTAVNLIDIIDINRTPANVGKYIDANGESPPLSESAASGEVGI